MKKGEKKLLSALSVTLVIVMALMGCSGSGGNTASPKSDSPSSQNNETPSTGDAFVLGEKPLEFSFYGYYDWYTMPDWGADLATKWIQENKKVNVVPVSSGGVAKNKLSTMIVSGELPDVIWMEPGAEVEKLRSEGMLVPFDDYLDKYPNLKKWAGESTLELLRSPDGKLYQFPNWYTTQPNGNAGYLVNKKIY
ncbi:extracellular solute-binding protein, partial [Paenibacillus glucanolyticus]